jgi:hypothetical protein
MVGDWKKGPGLELFDALKAKLGAVPILAEDLGVITTDVVHLRCVCVYVCVCMCCGRACVCLYMCLHLPGKCVCVSLQCKM